MKLKPTILFVVTIFLVASCSLRYGHIPKVKAGKTHSAEKRHKPVKKLEPAFLANKKIRINVPATIVISEAYPVKTKQQQWMIVADTPDQLHKQADTTAAEIKPLRKQDMGLNDTNFYPVFNLVLVILLIILLLFVSALGAAALFDFIFFPVLVNPALFIAIILGAWVLLNYLIFTWIKRRITNLKNVKTTYNDTIYTEEEIKKMPREIRHKHAVNNLLAALILTVLTTPLLLFPPFILLTLLFFIASVYFAFKTLFTL